MHEFWCKNKSSDINANLNKCGDSNVTTINETIEKNIANNIEETVKSVVNKISDIETE